MTSRGHTYEGIAGRLGVSRQTVLTLVKRTYRKLQAHSKTGADYKAQQVGLLRR